MKRRLINVGTAVSLVLCVAMVALWVWSYFTREMVAWQSALKTSPSAQSQFGISSAGAAVDVYFGRFEYPPVPPSDLATGFWPQYARAMQERTGWQYVRPFKFAREPSWLGFGVIHEESLVSPSWGARATRRDSRGKSLDIRQIGWMVTVPYWFLVIITAAPPTAIAVLRWRKARAAARVGRCPTCGYDLRATPERCPECGAVPDAAQPAA